MYTRVMFIGPVCGLNVQLLGCSVLSGTRINYPKDRYKFRSPGTGNRDEDREPNFRSVRARVRLIRGRVRFSGFFAHPYTFVAVW